MIPNMYIWTSLLLPLFYKFPEFNDFGATIKANVIMLYYFSIFSPPYKNIYSFN